MNWRTWKYTICVNKAMDAHAYIAATSTTERRAAVCAYLHAKTQQVSLVVPLPENDTDDV